MADLQHVSDPARNSEPVTTVSIVLPTLNERGFIRDCLDSLGAQDHAGIVEILVVDGGSDDGTVEIAEAVGGRVRVLRNPRRTAAAGLNRGIQAAVGDVICRADAHTLYAPDYVRRCVEVLRATEADNVGGAWGVRIYVKPFIDWIWAGAFLMALGGFLAVSDRRYRLAVKQKFAALAGGAAA